MQTAPYRPLAIPHYIVLGFLFVVAFIIAILAWSAILVTGSHPSAIFNSIVGVGRWGLRVKAYAFLLGRAMHEQGFAALVTAVLHQRRPDSEVHFGKRRTGNWSTYRVVSVRETDRSP